MFRRVCGLDVHKETIVACLLIAGETGRAKKEVKTFPAHRRGLNELRTWLTEHDVEAVGMEGTGVYWRPVYGVLEVDAKWKLIVGNAQHIRNVPGRKTDVKDAEWIAQLVAHGLVRPSFVPSLELRELRDVTRSRDVWVADRTRDRNRVLKVLQTAGIKIDGVASDAFGKSGMDMLRALAAGTASPKEMAHLARGTLRKKLDALEVALESPLTPIHRRMLAMALEKLDATERFLASYDALIDEMLQPYQQQVQLLVTIPGVDRVVAVAILAELGPDMSVFPTAAHAASWAGVCPGNNESAGKSKGGSTTKGNSHLKTMLCQAANAVSRMKRGYLRDKFYRLKARRGHGRAIMAIAHKILIAGYAILKDGVPFADLGDNYLDLRNRHRAAASLLARLRAMGYDVTIGDLAPPTPTNDPSASGARAETPP